MNKLRGIYTYDIPDRVTSGIEGVQLEPVRQDLDAFRAFPDKESINLLIIRQGYVDDVLQMYPNVKWLQLLNAGFERVDLDLLKRRGIVFTNARSVYCATIAEDVIARILLLARNYRRHFEDQQRCFWPDDDQLPNCNIDLCGRVLGILGAGAIGHEIAKRANVFGMHVRGYDPYIKEWEGFEAIYGSDGGLERLLRESDFVVTSLPVTEETKDIINAETLATMKKSAFLINVARGQIIDEDALIDALNHGVIAGAAIDVAKQEPLPATSPLWTAKNLVITPHRAAYGDQMFAKMNALIERNIHHYLKGEPLEDRIL
ncbi:MAG: NAD(P)-dependent oxidoreductase [Candidatus Excrementavichristensenella sp.]|jgi:phosphoglycerate dehydrogenase-like enzyme